MFIGKTKNKNQNGRRKLKKKHLNGFLKNEHPSKSSPLNFFKNWPLISGLIEKSSTGGLCGSIKRVGLSFNSFSFSDDF